MQAVNRVACSALIVAGMIALGNVALQLVLGPAHRAIGHAATVVGVTGLLIVYRSPRLRQCPSGWAILSVSSGLLLASLILTIAFALQMT